MPDRPTAGTTKPNDMPAVAVRLPQTAEELLAKTEPSPCDPDLIRRRHEAGLARQAAQEAEYAGGPLDDEERVELHELQRL
jgi:hypothetical protein